MECEIYTLIAYIITYMDATKKVCTCCKRKLELSEFGQDQRNKDKHVSKCRACTVKYIQAWQKANWGKYLETQRDYRLKAKETHMTKAELLSFVTKLYQTPSRDPAYMGALKKLGRWVKRELGELSNG